MMDFFLLEKNCFFLGCMCLISVGIIELMIMNDYPFFYFLICLDD